MMRIAAKAPRLPPPLMSNVRRHCHVGRLATVTRSIFGYRELHVLKGTPSTLEIAYGRTVTTFDKPSEKILRNGSLVGMFPLVRDVELHRPVNPEGPPNWFITVHLSGARQVEVGQTSHEAEASQIAARISTLLGRPVVLGAIL